MSGIKRKNINNGQFKLQIINAGTKNIENCYNASSN
jgi:hypothetical protein